jgi:hypothetical protein
LSQRVFDSGQPSFERFEPTRSQTGECIGVNEFAREMVFAYANQKNGERPIAKCMVNVLKAKKKNDAGGGSA